MDTVMYQLTYPQIPLVQTNVLQISGYNELPSGQNAVIAVMGYSGFDIEDAVIMNKASVERGLYHAVISRKYTS